MSDLLDKARALEAQLRADDAAMPAQWDCIPLIVRFHTHDRPLASVSFHIARTRNALPAIADTLRDLSAEVERLHVGTDRVIRAVGEVLDSGEAVALISNAACEWCSELWPHLDGKDLETARAFAAKHATTCAANSMRAERDAALARVKELSIETERLADEDTERYRLGKRVKELEAEVAAMTPVVESACAWRDRGDYDDATDACNAVDAYRARKP